MEGAHGELGPGLADALCGDDAHGHAHLYQAARGRTASVAEAADAPVDLADEGGAHMDPVDAQRLDSLRDVLIDLLAAKHDYFVALGIDDV